LAAELLLTGNIRTNLYNPRLTIIEINGIAKKNSLLSGKKGLAPEISKIKINQTRIFNLL